MESVERTPQVPVTRTETPDDPMKLAPVPTRRPARCYTEKDLTAVLKRALELQSAGDTSGGATTGPGFTAADLEEIAGRMGVEPRNLRAAVEEFTLRKGKAERFTLLGLPLEIEVERLTEGRISEQDWPEIVDEIRQAFRQVGIASQVGNSREWISRRGAYLVTLRPAGDRTRLRAKCDLRFKAIPFFLPPLYAAGIAAALIGATGHLTPALQGLVAAGLFGGAIAAGRLAFGAWTARLQRKLDGMMERLESRIAVPERNSPDPAFDAQPPTRPEAPAGIHPEPEPRRTDAAAPGTDG